MSSVYDSLLHSSVRVANDILKSSFPDGPSSVRALAKAKTEEKKDVPNDGSFEKILKETSDVVKSYHDFCRELEAKEAKEVKKSIAKKRKKQKQPKPKRPEPPRYPLTFVKSRLEPLLEPKFEPEPIAIPEPEPVKFVSEELMSNLILDPSFRKHPIAKHPHAIDHTLVAIASAANGTDSVPLEKAYDHMTELLHLETYVDSPLSYYQDTRKLLQALRIAVVKAGLAEADKKTIKLTDIGADRIKTLNNKVSPVELVPQWLSVPVPAPVSVPAPSPLTAELVEYDRILAAYDEDLSFQQLAIKGIDVNLESAKKKLEAVQREVDTLTRKRAECENKIASIETDAEQLLVEREKLLN